MIQTYFVYCLGILEPIIFDYNKRLFLLSVILLSGWQCICFFTLFVFCTLIGKSSEESFGTSVKVFCTQLSFLETHKHTLSLPLTNTHSLSLSQTHSLSPSHKHTLSLPLTNLHTLSLSQEK